MATKNKLEVSVNTGDEFYVEVNLEYTPEELQKEKVRDFLKKVKKEYCEALDAAVYKEECEKYGFAIKKLKEFDLTWVEVKWGGINQMAGFKRYKRGTLNDDGSMYDLLDRSKVDCKMPKRVLDQESAWLEEGYYPHVHIGVRAQ